MRSNTYISIRPTKIKFYLRCFERLYGDADKLLYGTDLNRIKLDDPYLLVDIPSYLKVVSNLLRHANTPELAFRLGEELIPSDFGILGHAFSACDNKIQGFKLWQKYNHLFFGNLIQVTENPQKSTGTVFWCEMTPLVNLRPHLLRFFIEEIICIERHMFKKFSDDTSTESFYHFSYSAPSYAHLYTKLLRCNVQFNQETNSIGVIINETSKAQTFPRRDKETLRLCTKYLEEISTILEHKITWTARVREVLWENLPNLMKVQDLANKFNCSVSSLYRHLNREGTTYTDILAELRQDQIKNYLATTLKSIDEISIILGFNDTNSLRRSFKHWTGMTINEYKDTLINTRNER